MIYMRVYKSKLDPYKDWILENYTKYDSYKDLANKISEVFDIEVSPYTLKDWLRKHVEGTVYGVRGEWSEEEITFLKENYSKGVSYISKKLGRSKQSVTGMAFRLNLKVGDKVKHQPQRVKRGTIRKDDIPNKPPRMMIKISDGHDGWIPLARYVWMWHNEPIADGNVIIFLDGDSTNCHISNLSCISQKVSYQVMTNWHYKSHNPEITKTLIKYYELRNALGFDGDSFKAYERKLGFNKEDIYDIAAEW